MGKTVEFEGKQYDFPEDATDAEISIALGGQTAPPSTLDVVKAIPREAQRQLVGAVAGADILLGDITGSETARNRGLGVKRELAADPKLENMTPLQEGILSGGASALTQVPAMAAAALSAPVSIPTLVGAATTSMGLQTAFSRYGDERQAGFQPARAGVHAMVEGLIEKYTEFLPLKELKVGAPLWQQARRYLAKEFAGEQLATLGQDISAKLSDQPDMTLGDYFHDALVTAIATPVAGALQVGAASGAQLAARALQGGAVPSAAPTPSAETPVPTPPIPPTPEAPPAGPPPVNAGPVVADQAGVAPPATAPLFLDPNAQPVGQATGMDSHGNFLQSLGVENNEQEVAKLGLIYVDSSGEKELLIAGAPLWKEDEVTRVAQMRANALNKPVDVAFDEKRFTVEPGPVAEPSKIAVEPVRAAGVEDPADLPGTLTEPVPAQASTSGAEPIRVDSLKANAILFPDAKTKALWKYGSALTRLETTIAVANSKALDALRGKAKEASGIKEDTQLDDTAQRYVFGVMVSGLRKAKKGTYSAPTLENALSAQKVHEQSFTNATAAGVNQGQVAYYKALPSGDKWLGTMQAYLQAWVKTFSPKMRVIIMGTQEGDPGTRARTWYYGGVHYVYVPRQGDTMQKALALYVLAHEFGHMIVNQHLNDPKYVAIKDKLIAEYTTFISRASGMTSDEFVRKFRSPINVIGGDYDPNLSLEAHLENIGVAGITFDEWLADQMVRYVHTNDSHLKIPSEKAFWKPLFNELKTFFQKVVRKFAPSQTYSSWLESLRLEDSGAAVTELTAPPSPRIDRSISQEDHDNYEYTTRVLSRLPNKPFIKKVTIYGELGRADVRKQERELIGKILHDIPGESVDTDLFKERVLGEVVPLTMYMTGRYANYGIPNLGRRVMENDDFLRRSDMPDNAVYPRTHIWQGRGVSYTSPHFTEQSNEYWAHARGFVQWEPMSSSSWNIIELQSDLEQHHGGDAIEDAQATAELNAAVEDSRDALSILQKLRNIIYSPANSEARESERDSNIIAFMEGGPEGLVHRHTVLTPRVRQMMQELKTAIERKDPYRFELYDEVGREMDSLVVQAQATLEDFQARKGQKTEVPSALPDKWWELVLRHETTWAARVGRSVVRMATADTVVKVEGWLSEDRFQAGEKTVPAIAGMTVETTAFYPYAGQEPVFKTNPSLDGKDYVDHFEVQLTGRVLLNDDEDFHLDAVHNGVKGFVQLQSTDIVNENGPGGLVDIYTAFRPDKTLPIREQLPRDVRSIYDRYAGDITKFVKREFGAKEYTDTEGHTWLEWNTNEALKTMPIVYYNMSRAVEDVSDEIGPKADVPELPKTFVRFQGFLQSILQLNQLAKILPDLVGLQRYRTSMRNLHALKAKLFEGPNDRIHEWHKLGRVQARRVEQALKDEQLSGEHWTALVQTDVEGKPSWVHVPTESFKKFMEERGIQEEGQQLFLGVKNDFLSTLTAMEQVIRRHTEQFFAKNEVVLTKKLNAIESEFKGLREKPYLPDMRFGRYSVQVRAGSPQTIDGREIKKNELVYWEKFESKRARDRRYAELKRTLPGHNVSASYDDELVSNVRGLPQSVVEAMTETLNSDPTTALSQDQMAALEQIEFDQTAVGKFAKYLGTPAKHIAGSSKDMRRAYAAYHWKMANAIAKLNYFKSLTGAMNAVRADAKKVRQAGGVSDPYDKVAAYLQNNFSYVMQPQHEFEQIRALVSLWYLWGSAKTAAMNLTSVPVLTFPYLGARFGMLQSQAALLRAMKDVVQYWRNPEKLSQDKQRVLAQLKADGVTDQSFASMLASVSDGGIAFEKIIPTWESTIGGEAVDVARRATWQITALGMAPFRVVEQFNRQITGLAAYELMAAKTGKTLSNGDTEAYNFARDAVDYTQNEYGAWNRPPMMQGKQSVFLLFFSFVQNMSFLMFGGDKSWWRAMMVLGAMAGLQGLPGMDNILDMFNWVARKLTGQYVDLRHEARAVARELGMNPDMVMHGISHNWLGLGWDTSTSVGAGRIIPGTDAIFGVGKFEDRFLHATSEVGGPVGSLLISFLQAAADDNPSELLRWDRALPPVLRNIEKAYTAIVNDAWVNAKGRPVAQEPDAAELVGQALGFAPTRRTERGEELRAAKDIVEFYKERRTNLMEALWSAKRTHDSDVVADVRMSITDFNAMVPTPHLRITAEDISSSMQYRQRLDRETATMRSPQKRYRDIYRYIDELY
jgi:hypothetical protein